jgi:hypothetical protein
MLCSETYIKKTWFQAHQIQTRSKISFTYRAHGASTQAIRSRIAHWLTTYTSPAAKSKPSFSSSNEANRQRLSTPHTERRFFQAQQGHNRAH